MALSQAEFEAILADDSKRIVGDIVWESAGGHADARRFDVHVSSDAGRDLVVQGYFRPSKRKLALSLIAAGRRVAGVDFGSNVRHRNLSGTRVTGPHLQFWSEQTGEVEARPLPEAAPDRDQPAEVWAWMCERLGILHLGDMIPPDDDETGQ